VVDDFNMSSDRVFRTDHWVEKTFRPGPVDRASLLPDIDPEAPILLYAAGRVSEEKGVMSLPAIVAAVKREIPNVRLVVCGVGPSLEQLKTAIPDGVYLGWVVTRCSQMYSAPPTYCFFLLSSTRSAMLFSRPMPVVSP
jgi:glycosyltransferase involved in cell wall biosynthesis